MKEETREKVLVRGLWTVDSEGNRVETLISSYETKDQIAKQAEKRVEK